MTLIICRTAHAKWAGRQERGHRRRARLFVSAAFVFKPATGDGSAIIQIVVARDADDNGEAD
jgi:hypothetical protein